jgi:hypothetical protein
LEVPLVVEGDHIKAPRGVSAHGNVVVKLQEPGASRRERERTQAGRVVGEQTGLFVVPKIVSFDDARGEIVFERLNQAGLYEPLSDPGKSVEMAGRAASALAAIHTRMQPPEGYRSVDARAVSDRHPRAAVPLNGDFCMTNLLYLPESNGIAIIDWSNADWIGFDGDLGAPEIDVGVFIISLFHRRPFGPWPVARRREAARHFLSTYASASPHGLDMQALRSFVSNITPSFVQMTRRMKGNLRALSYRHSMIDLAFFLR